MKKSAIVRSMLALVAAVATAAGAGSSSISAAQGGSQHGTAQVVIDFSPTGTGFPYVSEDGVLGRNVTLIGDIQGTNFEPGFCNDNVGPEALPAQFNCVPFGDGAGQFTRLAPGGTAFTTCHCTVGGVGNEGDTVVLKISYPPATPPQYPGQFTKFTFQHGTGALSGLSGQGTLDLATGQITVTYRFPGK